MMIKDSGTVRRAAVAGMFYPGDRTALRQQLARLLEGSPAAPRIASNAPDAPKVLIVPHAGYVYSGQTAALAYARLATHRARIERVVLLGPAHRVYLQGMAVPSVKHFATPLGEISLDGDALNVAAAQPGVVVDDGAHALEHSLEVQLPFLQTVLHHFTLIPVVVGDAIVGDVARLIDTLWAGEETLIVVSTDLSHFHDYDAARELSLIHI